MKLKVLFFVILLNCSNVFAEIIFESDFTEDLGYVYPAEGQTPGLFETSTVPTGWDGVRVSGNGSIEVVTDPEISIKPILKLTWGDNLSQPVVNLLKHLTNSATTGYDELYIRYHVRLPNNFKAGDGVQSLPYWKWGRLWQNTDPSVSSGTWTENRVDSFYVVWNFAGSVTYGIDANITFGANTGVNLASGSAGGERYLYDYYSGIGDFTLKEGHFQAVGSGAWDIDWVTNPGFLASKTSGTSQTWHMIEYRVKTAIDNSSNDGIWEMWFDGEKQNLVRGEPKSSASALPSELDIPTTADGQSGFNFFTFFDNMAIWNTDWDQTGVDGFIYVNDVVVSTTPIGSEYIIGQPKPPTGLTIK